MVIQWWTKVAQLIPYSNLPLLGYRGSLRPFRHLYHYCTLLPIFSIYPSVEEFITMDAPNALVCVYVLLLSFVFAFCHRLLAQFHSVSLYRPPERESRQRARASQWNCESSCFDGSASTTTAQTNRVFQN